jgi:putative phage-type endonuclease
LITEIKYSTHEEWLDIRSKYIGGSDAAAVIGMNPYKSRYSLWAEKTNKVPPFEGNLTTKVGAYLEQLVADLFEEETGKKVRKKNSTMVNDLYPFACANVDRMVVGEKAFLEIKTTNSIPLMKTLRNSDEFPEQYYCQVVHYLAVTGLEKAYLAVLINCRELKIYEMERDQAEIDALMNAEKDFWELVKKDTAPSPDGSEATTETLKTLYPNANGETVDLFAYNSLLDQYCDLTSQIKALSDLKEEVGNRVKEFMKEAGKGESDRFSVSYANTTRKTFDAKRFSAENGNLNLDPYYNVTKSRIFKVTPKNN